MLFPGESQGRPLGFPAPHKAQERMTWLCGFPGQPGVPGDSAVASGAHPPEQQGSRWGQMGSRGVLRMPG